MDIVRVKWLDATEQSGWAGTQDAREMPPLKCLTYGMVLKDNEVGITLVHTALEDESQVLGVFLIPRAQILDVVYYELED